MDNALEIHAHYSKLFEAFAVLPPDDIGSELFDQACELWAESPWDEFGAFLKRVESYLEQSQLSPERRAAVAKFLAKQKPHYERGVWLVETRPRVIKHDEPDLKRRLSMGGIYPMFESVNPQDRNNHLAKVRAEVKRRLDLLANQQELQAPATTEPLDTPAFTVIKSQAQVLSEMIAQIATDAEASANAKGFTLVGKPDNPVPPVPALDTPTAPTRVIATINAPTVADLCRLPFTPAGLNELLVRLKVISPAGTCLTNDLKGKAQGPRAAFTAAYRVLHRAELLNPVVDKVWAAAFLQAYGAKLGKCAISHKLTVHGTATAAAPLPFTEAVNIAREWVNEWQSRR